MGRRRQPAQQVNPTPIPDPTPDVPTAEMQPQDRPGLNLVSDSLKEGHYARQERERYERELQDPDANEVDEDDDED